MPLKAQKPIKKGPLTQMKFNKVKEPNSGQKISYIDGVLNVPDNPIIPYIEGDGIGVDITHLRC